MTDRELMQQALDALGEYVGVVVSVNDPNDWTPKIADAGKPARIAIEALRARLAQPEQEPVAWLYKKKDGMQVITDDPDYADGTWIPLYTAPPKILCGCGDQIMPNDGAECGNCVAARNA